MDTQILSGILHSLLNPFSSAYVKGHSKIDDITSLNEWHFALSEYFDTRLGDQF